MRLSGCRIHHHVASLVPDLKFSPQRYAAKQLFHIGIVHPYTTQGYRLANRTRVVVSMDSVAVGQKAQPAATQRVVCSRRYRFAAIRWIPGRIYHLADYPKLPHRRRRGRLSHCHWIRFYYVVAGQYTERITGNVYHQFCRCRCRMMGQNRRSQHQHHYPSQGCRPASIHLLTLIAFGNSLNTASHSFPAFAGVYAVAL